MSNLKLEEQQKLKAAAFGFAKKDTDELFLRMQALQKLKSKTQLRSSLPQKASLALLKKRPDFMMQQDGSL